MSLLTHTAEHREEGNHVHSLVRVWLVASIRVRVLKREPRHRGVHIRRFPAALTGTVKGLAPEGTWPTGKVNGTEGRPYWHCLESACNQGHVCSAV